MTWHVWAYISNVCAIFGIIGSLFSFLGSRDANQEISPWKTLLHSLFLIVESLTKVGQAWSALDVLLASFVTSLMSLWCVFGVILVGQPQMGRFTFIPCFLYLYIMFFSLLLIDLFRLIGYTVCYFLRYFSLLWAVKQILLRRFQRIMKPVCRMWNWF